MSNKLVCRVVADRIINELEFTKKVKLALEVIAPEPEDNIRAAAFASMQCYIGNMVLRPESIVRGICV